MQAHESPRQPTTANEGQRRSTKAHSSQRSSTKAHSSTSRTTITRARDASRALFSSFYSPPPSLGPETRLGPSVSFYFFYFILYFTGAETCLNSCKIWVINWVHV